MKPWHALAIGLPLAWLLGWTVCCLAFNCGSAAIVLV